MSKRDLLARRETTFQERTRRLYDAADGKANENALVLRDDGVLAFGDVELTRVGVKFLEDLSRERWEQIVTMLAAANESLGWWIGDFFAYGERAGYGAAKATAARYGYEPPTVHNFTWVARNVEFSLRREFLSFGHHKIVARMDADDQQYWLAEAEVQGWSVEQLRQAVRGGDGGSDYTTVLKRFASSVKKASTLPVQDRRQLAAELRMMADALEAE